MMKNDKFQAKIRNFMYENSRKKGSIPFEKQEGSFFSNLMNTIDELDEYIDEKLKEYKQGKIHKR